MAFSSYAENCYQSTRSYITHAVCRPLLSRGINWLVRARISAIWTAKQAAAAKLISAFMAKRCPACENSIRMPELQHILFHCPSYVAYKSTLNPLLRQKVLKRLSPSEKLVVILGGTVKKDGEPLSLAAHWSGEGRKTLDGESVPGYMVIAQFLQCVMGVHMRALWKHKS